MEYHNNGSNLCEPPVYSAALRRVPFAHPARAMVLVEGSGHRDHVFQANFPKLIKAEVDGMIAEALQVSVVRIGRMIPFQIENEVALPALCRDCLTTLLWQKYFKVFW